MSRRSIEIPDVLHPTIKAKASKAKASLRGLSLRDYVLRRLNATEELEEAESGTTRFSDAGLAGIWSERDDMRDPEAWVREQRQGRAFGSPPDAD